MKLENNTDRKEIHSVKFRKVDKTVLERLEIDENKDDRELGKEMADEAGEAREDEKSASDPSMVPFKLLTPNDSFRRNCL